jgi:hypothetical protein
MYEAKTQGVPKKERERERERIPLVCGSIPKGLSTQRPIFM